MLEFDLCALWQFGGGALDVSYGSSAMVAGSTFRSNMANDQVCLGSSTMLKVSPVCSNDLT